MDNSAGRSSIRSVVTAAFLLGSAPAWSAVKLSVDDAVATSFASVTVDSLAGSLGLEQGSDFKVQREAATAHGTRTVRLQQYWKGVPVLDGVVTAEINVGGTILTKRGDVLIGLTQEVPSIKPRLSETAARALWRKATGADDHAQDRDITLYVQAEDGQAARLVYLLSHVMGGSRPTAIMDANTGEILDRWEGMTTAEVLGPGGNRKTGRYIYGVNKPKLKVSREGDRCTTITPDVETYHAHNTGTASGGWIPVQPKKWLFPCFFSTGDAVNGAYDPINDAHHFGGVVFDMYKNYLNTRPLQQTLKLIVHVGNAEENASWDGQQMLFGDGASQFYPMVSLDVIAHEVSHGFTEQNSGLIYQNQSGGMNEAFSDMAGEAAKWYENGKNDFLVGADVFKAQGEAFRYMCEPTRDGISIDHAKNYEPGMGVHYSSGVYNKAFCLLAKRAGWDSKKAFFAFARANMLYWKRNETFDHGACGVQSAAKDLDMNETDVTHAFEAVGVMCKRG